MDILKTDFEYIANFLLQASGYQLLDEKKYLLETRLEDVLKSHGLMDVSQLVSRLKDAYCMDMANDIIEAMTVNETFFFRDKSPFDTFEEHVIPQLQARDPSETFRIWSAACSTGQEAYSIAMLMAEHRHKFPKLKYEIIASDINTNVLNQARRGLYSDLEVNRGLPEAYREKYFTMNGERWQIDDEIRQAVKFYKLNLHEPYPFARKFDFVMLRNVLIYFNDNMKEAVLNRISYHMNDCGKLLLGAAEGIYDMDHYFQRCDIANGLYILNRT